MISLFARKIERFTKLPDDDHAALEAACDRTRRYRAREDIIREGDKPKSIDIIMSGWAARYKVIEDGRRQIVAFLLPGDLFDAEAFLLPAMDHSIAAVTPVTCAEIPRETMDDILRRQPRLAQAMWRDTLVALSIQREWTLSLGQRSALERIAQLLCELFLRLGAVGLTRGDSCDFPLTQSDLAEATGLTSVHVNRTLQELRARGLVSLSGRELTVPDLAALKAASAFNGNYLHLDD